MTIDWKSAFERVANEGLREPEPRYVSADQWAEMQPFIRRNEYLEKKLQQAEKSFDIAIRALNHIAGMRDTEGDEHCSVANSTLKVLALVRQE